MEWDSFGWWLPSGSCYSYIFQGFFWIIHFYVIVWPSANRPWTPSVTFWSWRRTREQQRLCWKEYKTFEGQQNAVDICESWAEHGADQRLYRPHASACRAVAMAEQQAELPARGEVQAGQQGYPLATKDFYVLFFYTLYTVFFFFLREGHDHFDLFTYF